MGRGGAHSGQAHPLGLTDSLPVGRATGRGNRVGLFTGPMLEQLLLGFNSRTATHFQWEIQWFRYLIPPVCRQKPKHPRNYQKQNTEWTMLYLFSFLHQSQGGMDGIHIYIHT